MRSRTRHKKRKNKQKGGLFPFGQENSYLTTLKNTIQALPGKILDKTIELRAKIDARIAGVTASTGGSTRRRKHRKH